MDSKGHFVGARNCCAVIHGHKCLLSGVKRAHGQELGLRLRERNLEIVFLKISQLTKADRGLIFGESLCALSGSPLEGDNQVPLSRQVKFRLVVDANERFGICLEGYLNASGVVPCLFSYGECPDLYVNDSA